MGVVVIEVVLVPVVLAVVLAVVSMVIAVAMLVTMACNVVPAGGKLFYVAPSSVSTLNALRRLQDLRFAACMHDGGWCLTDSAMQTLRLMHEVARPRCVIEPLPAEGFTQKSLQAAST